MHLSHFTCLLLKLKRRTATLCSFNHRCNVKNPSHQAVTSPDLEIGACAESPRHGARDQDNLRRRVGLNLLDGGPQPPHNIPIDGVLDLRPLQAQLQDP
jgi:hypothetical protein